MAIGLPKLWLPARDKGKTNLQQDGKDPAMKGMAGQGKRRNGIRYLGMGKGAGPLVPPACVAVQFGADLLA